MCVRKEGLSFKQNDSQQLVVRLDDIKNEAYIIGSN